MSGRPSWLRSAGVIAAVWLAYGLFSVYQSRIFSIYVMEKPQAWGFLFKWAALLAVTWALVTPAIMWLARRFRISRRSWYRNMPLHLALSFVFATLDVAIEFLLRPRLGIPFERPVFSRVWMWQFDMNFAFYFVIAAVTHAVDYHRWFRERQVRAAQLEAETAQLESRLARSQLQVLKMQLQPHFLFNTLHTIAELVHENPKAADRMVTGLGDLLRMSLDNAGRQEVTLRQELAFLEAYLDIEQIRHQERLAVHTAVEPETLEARVPHLVLQPLVENAIRHGIGARLEQGRIEVSAARHDGRLEIEIADNGGGLPEGGAGLVEGIGLRNTRARLEQLYGRAHRLDIVNRAEGGVVARLSLPWQTGADELIGEHRVAVEGDAASDQGAGGGRRGPGPQAPAAIPAHRE
jgi:two-component system, LytTR family, sensor kinase